MRTIENHNQIDNLLKQIDQEATKAINAGLKFTVEWRDDGITQAQFNALHVWIRLCVQYLNDNGFFRRHPVSGNPKPWTEISFKEDVYKTVLKWWKGKNSTKDQNTIEPNEIVMAITGHLATEYTGIILPEWPSNR